jgi:hypothetical protein
MKPSDKRISEATDNFLCAIHSAMKGRNEDARPYVIKFALDLLGAVEERNAERLDEAIRKQSERMMGNLEGKG